MKESWLQGRGSFVNGYRDLGSEQEFHLDFLHWQKPVPPASATEEEMQLQIALTLSKVEHEKVPAPGCPKGTYLFLNFHFMRFDLGLWSIETTTLLSASLGVFVGTCCIPALLLLLPAWL